MRSQPSRKRGRADAKSSKSDLLYDQDDDSGFPVATPAVDNGPKKKKKKCSNANDASNNRPEPAVAVPTDEMSADDRRQQMKDAFLPWVMQTYGDAAKTKTISRRKSERIAKILRGEDRSNGADSSKFRFWVRAKGFRLGCDDQDQDSTDLYVVTSTTKDEAGGEEKPVYKKVAVVEEFFDIIYREHVEFMNQGGKPAAAGGKHAGQKRTYRAITEIYAFLPREAVTRFLMQCAECQRRGSGTSTAGASSATTLSGVSPGSPTPPASPATAASCKPLIKLTTSTPSQSRTLISSRLPLADIDLSLPLTSTLLKRAQISGVSHQQLLGLDRAESSFCSPPESAASCSPQSMTAGFKSDEEASVKSGHSGTTSSTLHIQADCDPAVVMATPGLSPNTVLDGEHSPAIKDEDDDDDDEADDKIDSQVHDPERLKAFNMFVRLFVDENLDRMVPISRQPKEKVQAIIDSCLRQFPEFGERARKRIRTYLKSCRRNKRSALDLVTCGTGNNNSNSLRPMPPHLTSVVAEQILAQACDNENQNAKRLRLGLEPISQPLPASLERLGANETATVTQPSPSPSSNGTEPSSSCPPAASAGTSTNLFRPAFGPYQRSGSVTPAPSTTNNFGATDLSMKSSRSNGPASSSSSHSSPLPHRLNAAEMLAVRQLVTGYRESAQFLLRSAEELEQLLFQQQQLQH